MAAKRTIAELAKRQDELNEELSEVRAEIAFRAGEVDPPKAAVKASAKKAVAKQAANK